MSNAWNVDETLNEYLASTSTVRHGAYHRMHLLVIDDNECDVQLIREACSEHFSRCHIQSFQDGVAAIAYLTAVVQQQIPPPDVILCDINMPRMNGIEFLNVFAQHSLSRSVTVIMCSSTTQVETTSRCAELGASSFNRR